MIRSCWQDQRQRMERFFGCCVWLCVVCLIRSAGTCVNTRQMDLSFCCVVQRSTEGGGDQQIFTRVLHVIWCIRCKTTK